MQKSVSREGIEGNSVSLFSAHGVENTDINTTHTPAHTQTALTSLRSWTTRTNSGTQVENDAVGKQTTVFKGTVLFFFFFAKILIRAVISQSVCGCLLVAFKGISIGSWKGLPALNQTPPNSIYDHILWLYIYILKHNQNSYIYS